MSKNFNEVFTNFSSMLADEDAWQITDGEFFSVKNMTDEELGEAIINDILIATFFEKEGNTVNFTPEILIRFLCGSIRAKVLKKLQSKELAGYLDTTNGQLRIKNDRNILQAAQDYAGVVFDGFEFTDQTQPYIKIDHDTVRKEIDKAG